MPDNTYDLIIEDATVNGTVTGFHPILDAVPGRGAHDMAINTGAIVDFGGFDFTLSAKTIIFEAGSTQTLELGGVLTLKGADDNLLALKSSTEGEQWNMDPQDEFEIELVDVMDSENLGPTYLLPYPTSSINSGNTTKWFTPKPTDNGGKVDWTDRDQNYLKIPVQPVYMVAGLIAYGADVVNIDQEMRKKYNKNYAKGKYKTVVTVIVGSVYVAPYDDKGPQMDKAVDVTAGKKLTQSWEVK